MPNPTIIYIQPKTDVPNPELELLELEGYPCCPVHTIEDAKKLLQNRTFRFVLIDIRDNFTEDLKGWRGRCLEFLYDSDFHHILKIVICTDMKSTGIPKEGLGANSVIHFHLIEERERFVHLISVLHEYT